MGTGRGRSLVHLAVVEYRLLRPALVAVAKKAD